VKEGQWSELCSIDGLSNASADGVLCAAQEIRLQYVFSTSFLCLSAANAFFGVLLDVVGPRMTVVLGLSLSALGNAALAIGDSKAGTGSLIIAGYAMVGAGGMGSYLASFQILQLYQVQGFVCSTLSSLFNCSGYVYMLLQLEHGVTRQEFFGVYGYAVYLSPPFMERFAFFLLFKLT
jgi:MFS family permease